MNVHQTNPPFGPARSAGAPPARRNHLVSSRDAWDDAPEAPPATAPPPHTGHPPVADDELPPEFLDGLEASFILMDTRYRVLRWNRAAERMLRVPSHLAIGRSAVDLFVPPASRPIADEVNAKLAQGESWTGNLPLRRGDGTELLSRGTRSPVINDRGVVVALCSFTFDLYGDHIDLDARIDELTPHNPPRPPGPELLVLPHRRRAFVDDRELQLTSTEFAILDLLMAERGRVISLDEISAVVWGHGTMGEPNFVQAHVARLRSKLRTAGAGSAIRTVRGVGYTVTA